MADRLTLDQSLIYDIEQLHGQHTDSKAKVVLTETHAVIGEFMVPIEANKYETLKTLRRTVNDRIRATQAGY